jgi:hypothetical protein
MGCQDGAQPGRVGAALIRSGGLSIAAMRRLLATLLIALPVAASAQQPPKLEPVPEPPPAVGVTDDPDAPGIILQRGQDQYEEMEMDGQRVIKVTQPNGFVYYLVEARPGDGPFAGASNTDNRIRVPQWRVLQW